MTYNVTAHLYLRGQGRSALDFYKGVPDPGQTLVTYGQMGQDPRTDGDEIIWG